MITMTQPIENFREGVFKPLCRMLIDSEIVAPPHWQGVNISEKPDMQTRELLNVILELKTGDTYFCKSPDLLGAYLGADLPWAEDHFQERVCGVPVNPGTEWANWRMGAGADDFRDKDGFFNHNYMERIWPKFAHLNRRSLGPTKTSEEWMRKLDGKYGPGKPDVYYVREGIAAEYGDLSDLVLLLLERPLARQAFLPMFFPEDTGTKDRTPCTLGWHFILRDDRLHMNYYLRSCDFWNHFCNDLYMAIRLQQWILAELRHQNPQFWNNIELGDSVHHIVSLHNFRGTEHMLHQELQNG